MMRGVMERERRSFTQGGGGLRMHCKRQHVHTRATVHPRKKCCDNPVAPQKNSGDATFLACADVILT
jgi:hypothetical protein